MFMFSEYFKSDNCEINSIILSTKNKNCHFLFQNCNRFAKQIERALTDIRNLFIEYKQLNGKKN